MEFADAAREIAEVGRRFHARGWALGTSGNYSVVLNKDPLRLAISASSVAKGTMRATDVLEVDDSGMPTERRPGTPSAETLLHLEIARRLGAGAVLHTHSVWATILSASPEYPEGIPIEGFEMLKGLAGVRTHEHREWIPILENDQQMQRLAPLVSHVLEQNTGIHAFLLRRHGMYTWGKTLADAERHVEILEFLFEATGRSATLGSREHGGG